MGWCALFTGGILSILSLAFWLTGCHPAFPGSCPLMERNMAWITDGNWEHTACRSSCALYIRSMKEFNCEYFVDGQGGAMQFTIDDTTCTENAPLEVDCQDYQNWFTSGDAILYLEWDWHTERCHFPRKAMRYTITAIVLACAAAVSCFVAALGFLLHKRNTAESR